MTHQTVLVLDFGSQYTQLIARRIREQRVYSEILPPDVPAADLAARKPAALILSGGPDSVYRDGAPRIDAGILRLGVPILGICYGMQLMAHELGGKVTGGDRREYGPARLAVEPDSVLFRGIEGEIDVLMSHGDHLAELPAGFVGTASTARVPHAAAEDAERLLFGMQFHPEVLHTPRGTEILRNFLFEACALSADWRMSSFVDETVAAIRDRVGPSDHVLCGLSGGVDSSVTALLLRRAIGERVTSVFVDNGLLRRGEANEVMSRFGDRHGLRVEKVDASSRFLSALVGITDPERKRRIVGETFIRVFEETAIRLGNGRPFRFLGQGTLYPDVIESTSRGGPSAVIKTHHNVGGLPERMNMQLVEPLRDLFKDEVRRIGRQLGLEEEFVRRHPFPGPGLAVRVLGEITPARLELLRAADAIFIEELRHHHLYDAVAQALCVLLPVRSVGVMGDARTYEHVVALRAVTTEDFMTADWARLPPDLIGRISHRIVNEVHGINRIVYDVTGKPPGTIEWE